MKLFLTNLSETKIHIFFFPESYLFPSLTTLLSKKHFQFHHLDLEDTTRFTRGVRQKSCVFKIVDLKAYLTLSERQKDNK